MVKSTLNYAKENITEGAQPYELCMQKYNSEYSTINNCSNRKIKRLTLHSNLAVNVKQ